MDTDIAILGLQGHAIKNQDLLIASGAISLQGPEGMSAVEEDMAAVSIRYNPLKLPRMTIFIIPPTSTGPSKLPSIPTYQSSCDAPGVCPTRHTRATRVSASISPNSH